MSAPPTEEAPRLHRAEAPGFGAMTMSDGKARAPPRPHGASLAGVFDASTAPDPVDGGVAFVG